MTVKIIAENILDDDDFSSATEQDGRYIGQPDPNSANSGSLRPVAKGDDDDDINDFSYDGTATANGSTTTIVDSVLSKLGDDFLNGATISFTSGANNGQSKTITDFAQSTGTITWIGAITSTTTGDTFTVTVDVDDFDYNIELVTSGDVGDAKLKWRWNTNWLGRKEIGAAWDGHEIIDSAANSSSTCKMLQLLSGDWMALFTDSGDDLNYRKSTDGGLTWGSSTEISGDDTYTLNGALVLSSGRVLAFALKSGGGIDMYYSDDDGSTWSDAVAFTSEFRDACELPNGNVLAVYEDSGNIKCRLSNDGGMTFCDAVTVSSAANDQEYPSVCVAKNGDVVCAYQSDEDSAGDDEIKAKISTDGGATWGSVIDVMDYGVDYQMPSVCLDVSGDVYVVFMGPSDEIYYKKSTDNGATWSAPSRIKDLSGDTGTNPMITLMDGHVLICSYLDDSNDDYEAVRAGMWATYTTVDRGQTVGVNGMEHRLICDVGLFFYGSAGISGDAWTIEPEYEHRMENIITDNPNRTWRSTQDNIACNILLEMADNQEFLADGVAFFNCNMRTLSYQMNTSDSWGSPTVDKSVDFVLDTGTIDSVVNNYFKDSALMADYKDHELSGKKIIMTSGTDDGVAWDILDNVGDYIVIDSTAATNVSSSDTFAVYGPKVAATFTEAKKDWMRIAISAQHTPDDYYQIGSMIVGKTISLAKAWLPGYTKTVKSGVEYSRPADGGLIPIWRRDNKRIFKVAWNASANAKDEVQALFDYLQGKSLALIPDDSDLADVYLVKLVGDLEMSHWHSTRFNFGMTFEEV